MRKNGGLSHVLYLGVANELSGILSTVARVALPRGCSRVGRGAFSTNHVPVAIKGKCGKCERSKTFPTVTSCRFLESVTANMFGT